MISGVHSLGCPWAEAIGSTPISVVSGSLIGEAGLLATREVPMPNSHSGVELSWTIASKMGSLCPVISPIHLS